MATRHLDHDTGLVYYEHQLRPQLSLAGWDKKPIERGPGRRRGRNRSLMDMAMTAVGDNLNLLSAQDLLSCPDVLAWRVWDHFHHEGRMLSFCAWKTFVGALANQRHPATNDNPFDHDAFRSYRVPIPEPKAPLAVFLDPLRSSRAAFLVRLTISHGASFAKSDMLALAGLENLCTLSILSPELDPNMCAFPRVDDRLLREWSLLPRPFPSLQALRIWGDDFATVRSLEHVLAFPRLRIYDVAGKHADWSFRKLDERYRSCWSQGRPEDPDEAIEAEVEQTSQPYASMFLGKTPNITPKLRYESCYTYLRRKHAPKAAKRPINSVSKPAAAFKGKRRLNMNINEALAQFLNP
ncbi:hypothetical protein PG999_013241 [Apiospora kogelbergensis]|uniref:Cbs domain-containing protein n=1 Tax=Apiospora kogelbergensis TaxID=1337665 RepID=A0AAW0QGZ2_9PEZI